MISNDKSKLQTYCEIGTLEDEMAKAEEGHNAKDVEALVAKAEALAQQIGPEYLKLVEGLELIVQSPLKQRSLLRYSVHSMISANRRKHPQSYPQPPVSNFVLIAFRYRSVSLVFRSLMET